MICINFFPYLRYVIFWEIKSSKNVCHFFRLKWLMLAIVFFVLSCRLYFSNFGSMIRSSTIYHLLYRLSLYILLRYICVCMYVTYFSLTGFVVIFSVVIFILVISCIAVVCVLGMVIILISQTTVEWYDQTQKYWTKYGLVVLKVAPSMHFLISNGTNTSERVIRLHLLISMAFSYISMI